MAGKNKVEVQIGITGEAQYNQSLKNINASQKALRAEMKTLQQTFNGQANSIQALQSKYDNLSKQYDLQKSKVDRYATSVEKARANEEKANAKVQESQKAYSEAQAKLDALTKSTDANSDAVKEQEEEVKRLGDELRSNVSALDNAATATANCEAKYNSANAELVKMDQELRQTEQYLDEAKTSSDGCARSIDEFGNEMGEAEKKTSKFGETALATFAGHVLQDALRSLVNGIKQVAESCVETGTQFEAAMSKVSAVSGAAGSDLDALTAKAKEMGSTTMFSASEAAEAMNYMAMAGWKTEDMLNGIEGVMSLAAASGEDLATTSDIVTDALTAFGLTAQDAGHFADVLAVASSNANTNVSMMGETFSYCAPIAGSLGFSVEDTAEAIGLMANSGIKASSAGTALRRIMTELSGEVKIHSKSMGDVTIATTNADGSMRGLSEILGDCRQAFAGLSESEQAAAAASLVGKNAMSGFLALMNAAPSDVEKLSSALDNCNGVAKEMADTMQDNLQGKITILKSALEGLAISTYDAFDDSLKEGVEGATEAIGQLNDAIVNGDLGVSLDRLGESASRLITDVVDDLVDHMPQIVNGLTELIDNADEIGSVLVTLIEAWGTYKIATEGAQAAQALLNAELAVNPVVAIAEAVLIAGNAMVAYARNVAKAGEEQLKLDKQTTPLIAETRKLTTSVNESKQAYEQSISDLDAQGAACDRLVDELISLNTQYQDSSAPGFSEAIAQQTSIISELNAAYPGLNLSINEHTGALNMSTDAIKSNIEAMQSQAYAEAAQERLTEIAKQKLDLDIQRSKLAPDIEEAEQNLTEAISAQKDAEAELVEVQTTFNGSLEESTEKALAARDAHLEAGHALSDLRGANAECEEQIASLSEEEEILTGKLRENAEAATQAGTSAGGATVGIEQLKLSEEELEDFVTAVNQSIESQTSLFDKFSEATTVSADELKGNLESQIEGLTEWESNFDALAEQIGGQGDALLKQLAEMGPAGNGYIKALLNMDDLTEYVTKYNEALQLKADATNEIVNTYLDAGVSVGEGFTEGVVQGHEETASEVTDAAEKVVEESKESATEKAEEFSDVGEQAMTSTSEGVTQNSTQVTEAVQKAGDEAYQTAEKAMAKDKFQTVGENISAGIAEGIATGASVITEQIQLVAQKAVETANASLKIESPSKVFRQVGEYIDLGLAEGIETKSNKVMEAINQTMNETVLAGASAVTTSSGMDSNSIAGVIARAIENGLGSFVMNVNADVDRDSIVDITVEANRSRRMRTGVGIYE